jgi:hypothetical protein
VIQNQHQYKVTNSKLKDLQQSLVELANNPRGLSERLLQAEKVGLQIWIGRSRYRVCQIILVSTDRYMSTTSNARGRYSSLLKIFR